MAPFLPWMGERLDRPRHRRTHLDALRRLAPHACYSPCQRRQSRPPRHRRPDNADRKRISHPFALGPAGYRLYRHPLVMFGLGPAYLFFLQQRLPGGLMHSGWRPWASAMTTNLSIALIAAGLAWLVGIEAFLLVHLPIVLLASTIGVWLFYVQHQFEHTAWEKTHLQRRSAWRGLVRQFTLRSARAAALVHRQYRRAPRASPL